MTNGRVKGANFEREIAKMIHETLGFDVKRNLEQYREADHGDLNGVPGWLIECKRYAHGITYRREWWQQCESAANTRGEQPVLIYKYDRHPIQCVVRLSSINPNFASEDGLCEMDFDTWAMIVRESLS